MMSAMKTALTMLAVGASLGLAGCGTAPTQACVTSFLLGAEPQSESGSSMGLANHALPAPGNQQQFIAFTGQVVVSGQCASTNVLCVGAPTVVHLGCDRCEHQQRQRRHQRARDLHRRNLEPCSNHSHLYAGNDDKDSHIYVDVPVKTVSHL